MYEMKLFWIFALAALLLLLLFELEFFLVESISKNVPAAHVYNRNGCETSDGTVQTAKIVVF